MAERLGDDNVIQLSNNTGGSPYAIKTNNTDIFAISAPTSFSLKDESMNIRSFNFDGVETKIRIANFIEESKIRLYGEYEQNFVDLPKYDLSKIIVVNDSEVDFNFILCLRDGNSDANPKLFATTKLYNSLLDNYSAKKPIPVNDIINERNIISIDLEPLKEKIEDLRILELNQDINLSSGDEKKYIEIIRNLFATSNYKIENGALKAEPTYDLIYLLRYISWVISKPSQNYNNRLLPVSQLGELNGYNTIPASPTEPSQNVTTTTSTPTNTSTPSNLYPPIGRKGVEDEEEVYVNGSIYIWDNNTENWFLQRPDDRD